MQLCLEIPVILFSPAVDIDDLNGFYAFYEGLMLDIMKMGTLIPRVDSNLIEERENYGVLQNAKSYLLILYVPTIISGSARG